jgi:hypothetical protein
MQVRPNSHGGLRVALCAGVMAIGLACASGNQRPGNPDNGGEGGDSGSGGSGGIEATAGVGGHSGSGGGGGKGGSGGSAGMTNGGVGGDGGSGAVGGSGGTSGSGGTGGGTTHDAGADSMPATSKDAGASGPTFTMVYSQIMSQSPMVPVSSCWAGACHAGPGGKDALAKIDMNSQAKAYLGVMKLVVPGKPATSKLFTEINLGKMPEKRPKLPPALIKLVSDWITAGAMNN